MSTADFWYGFLRSPDYLRSAEMTEVMMNAPSMEEIGLSPRKDGLSYQVSSNFLEPCDFSLGLEWVLVWGSTFRLLKVWRLQYHL